MKKFSNLLTFFRAEITQTTQVHPPPLYLADTPPPDAIYKNGTEYFIFPYAPSNNDFRQKTC